MVRRKLAVWQKGHRRLVKVLAPAVEQGAVGTVDLVEAEGVEIHAPVPDRQRAVRGVGDAVDLLDARLTGAVDRRRVAFLVGVLMQPGCENSGRKRFGLTAAEDLFRKDGEQ